MAVSLEKTSTIDFSSSIVNNVNGPLYGGLSITSSPTYDWTTYNSHDELADRITAIEERLLIVCPNELLQEKYPALKEAYDAYKLIEAIVREGKSV